VEALPEIEAAGARLIVVTPQSAARAAAWRDELSLRDALVIADPERTLYQALGARRPKPLWVLRPRVAAAGLRAVLARERVSVTRGDDTLQLGADVVVDQDGQIAFLHLASDAADRTPPEELISILRRLDDAPTASTSREIPAVG
jgi:hypothetical protein